MALNLKVPLNLKGAHDERSAKIPASNSRADKKGIFGDVSRQGHAHGVDRAGAGAGDHIRLRREFHPRAGALRDFGRCPRCDVHRAGTADRRYADV